jgi:putative ABC transport system permease protein
MLKNYFNIALRNLTKHKFYSIINILGLSVGLTCFLFIALFVKDEFSYDKHFRDSDRIYRVDFTGMINGSEFITALMSSPAAKTLKSDYPEVEDAFRMRSTGTWFVNRVGEVQTFKEENVVYADPNFFDFWGVKLLAGDAKTCLENPKTLVIDQTTATKIFGNENAVGQMVRLDNKDEYEVTGVYQDLPKNSHFHYNILLNIKDSEDGDSPMWMSFNHNTYVRIKSEFNPNIFEAKMPDLLEIKVGPEIERFMGKSWDEFGEMGNTAGITLMPLMDIHLNSDKIGEHERNGDIKYVYIFSAIGAFILLLACINFMNLATARSAGRAKEVGMRKVMGAVRSQLIRQFMSEAFLISLLSTVIAFLLSIALMPYFNEISGKKLIEMDLLSFDFILIMSTITLVVGLLAGSYPAFYLSKFKPVETLKGKIRLGAKSGGLRSVLVVLQFTVSIAMIIGTAVVYDQLSFVQNKKLGFNKNQVILINDVWILEDKTKAFKQEALRDSRIELGTISSFLPIGEEGNNSVYWLGKDVSPEDTYVINNHRIDYDYVNTLKMGIVDGRNFSREFPTDSLAILINQSMAKHMGLTEPVGSQISTYEGWNDSLVVVTYKVVGVVEDFHYASMKERIEPLLFKLNQGKGRTASFRTNSDDYEGTIASLESTWNEIAPGQPFTYSFLDEKFDRFYASEKQIGKIFSVFAFLAIFIACLGLFGLASFTAEQRIKEIGIRKVLGASIYQIASMLSWNFIRLVGVAFVFAAPIAYFGMKSWLDDFAYRTDIKIWIFIVAGVVAAVIAWLTMGLQSWKAARTNPANSLRND